MVVRIESDYYSILGVSQNSSKSEIKSSYRKLARQYHPDVNKEVGAEKKSEDFSNPFDIFESLLEGMGGTRGSRNRPMQWRFMKEGGGWAF